MQVRLISVRTKIYSTRSVIHSTSHDKRMQTCIATWHYNGKLPAGNWFVHKQIMLSTSKYITPRMKTTLKDYRELITNKYAWIIRRLSPNEQCHISNKFVYYNRFRTCWVVLKAYRLSFRAKSLHFTFKMKVSELDFSRVLRVEFIILFWISKDGALACNMSNQCFLATVALIQWLMAMYCSLFYLKRNQAENHFIWEQPNIYQ